MISFWKVCEMTHQSLTLEGDTSIFMIAKKMYLIFYNAKTCEVHHTFIWSTQKFPSPV